MAWNFFGTNNPISFSESSSEFHKRNNYMSTHTSNLPNDHDGKFGNYKSNYDDYNTDKNSSTSNDGNSGNDKSSFIGSWKHSEPKDTLSFEDRLNNQFAWIAGTTPYNSKDWSYCTDDK